MDGFVAESLVIGRNAGREHQNCHSSSAQPASPKAGLADDR